MNAIILVVSVVLPLLPIIMFPTRFFGRGLGSTLLGAGLLVGMMMLLYWSLGSFAGDTSSGSTDTAAVAGMSDADMAALEKLF